MTEMTHLFPEQSDEIQQQAAPDRRKVLLAGGLAAVLMLGGGGYYLFGGSGNVADTTASAARPSHGLRSVRAPVPSPSKRKGPERVTPVLEAAKVPAKSTEHLGRDPFKALYVQPVAAVAASAGGPLGSLPFTPATTPVPTVPTGTPGFPAPTGGNPAAPAKPAAYALKLMRVEGSGADLTAVFAVASGTQRVGVGHVFGLMHEIKLLSLQQGETGSWTSVIQVGDDQPFDAATGEVLHVQ